MASTDAIFESFVTLDQARQFMRLRADDTKDDALVLSTVNRVARFFETYTRRRLRERTYTNAIVPGSGTEVMFLPEYPVSDIASIKIDENRVFDGVSALVEFDPTGSQTAYDYVINDADSAELELVNGFQWPEATATILITFTAGIPIETSEDVQQAALLLIADWMEQAGRDPSLTQFSMGGLSKTYVGARSIQGNAAATAGLPSKTLTVLDTLRRASFE